MYGDRERFQPYKKNHSTVKEASELAETLGVKNLVLYHTEDSDIAHRKERYTKEASGSIVGRFTSLMIWKKSRFKKRILKV